MFFLAFLESTMVSNMLMAETPNQPAPCKEELGLTLMKLVGILAAGLENKPALFNSERA